MVLDPQKVLVGIAPIGWTNDDLPELGGEIPFEQCIDEMAAAGFAGCEVGNKYPRDPQTLWAALKPRQLQIASAWFSSFFTTQDAEATEARFLAHRGFLHAMGAKVIVVSESGKSIQGEQDVPVWPNKPEFTEQDWARLVPGLHRLGELAAAKDMKIVFHHHMGTGIQWFDDVVKLMERTDPELVSLLLDTGHIEFAGGSSLDMIEAFGPRIKHVHFKDLRPAMVERVKQEPLSFLGAVKQGVFTVPGDGMIDFGPIARALGNIGYEGWIVVEAEQDPALAPPLEYAQKAREHIREVAGI